MGKKKAAAAPAPRPAPKPINQRGAEYQAEKLTGKRAVQGKLANRRSAPAVAPNAEREH